MPTGQTSADPLRRCAWVSRDPVYQRYHDREWGVPIHDDPRLLELLVLEGAQSGLSWLTVLRRREGYRRVFAAFDPERLAAFSDGDLERCLADPGIIRHRGKVWSARANARALLALRHAHGSFAAYLWSFVDGRPIINHWRDTSAVPARTALGDRLARELRRHGFRFVGPTVCYAYLQACGLVMDHTTDCFRYPQLASG